MTEPIKRVTISFAVPSALHAFIGAVLTLTCLIAWWVHFALPADHAYKPTASDIATLAGSVALAYWLFCVVQRNRADAADTNARVAAAIAEAAAREKRLLAAFEGTTKAVLGVFREISEAITENRGSIKELKDAVDEGTATVKEAVGAVESLQNCYMREGTLLMLPNLDDPDEEEPPRDTA